MDEEGEDCVDIRRVQVDEESSKCSKAESQTQRTQGEKTRDSDFEQERIYIQSSPSRCPKSTKGMKSNIASTSSSKIQHDEKKKNKEIVMENDTEIDKRKRMDILRTKTSPITLHETIAELSNKQKYVVKGMGLGSILDMALTGVPSKLGFYVVDNLDTKSMQLKLKNGVIPITVESIHRVLGLPMGGIDLIGQKEIHEEMNLITQWSKQFENKKMRPTDVMSLIVESAESGFNFKLNFLVLFVNLMAECSTMGYCNYGFLRRIRNGYMIKEIDWCRYIYEKIRKSKARWIRESTTCYYAGPLTYLALLYVESTVSPWVEVGISGNALASWTMELLEKRETTEIRDGGLGLLPLKRKTKEVTVWYFTSLLQIFVVSLLPNESGHPRVFYFSTPDFCGFSPPKRIRKWSHYLRLKIGCPIILLRNIDPSNGLCNGTRLICRGFQQNVIDAEIAIGQHAGKRVFLPRIPLCPSDEDMFPFKLKRKQFPIRLCFAMTINKAQGQTIPMVGVYLPESVFSHGQLYVALSRGISRGNTKVLVNPAKRFDQDGIYTSNVVYQEVLTDDFV